MTGRRGYLVVWKSSYLLLRTALQSSALSRVLDMWGPSRFGLRQHCRCCCCCCLSSSCLCVCMCWFSMQCWTGTTDWCLPWRPLSIGCSVKRIGCTWRIYSQQWICRGVCSVYTIVESKRVACSIDNSLLRLRYSTKLTRPGERLCVSLRKSPQH